MSELLDDSVVGDEPSRKAKAPGKLPGKLDHALAWLRSNERWVFLCAAAFQLLVLTGMIAGNALPHWGSRVILLRVVPVDPRDLFRGDYVNLSYEISRPPSGPSEGLQTSPALTDRRDWQGREVYVTLAPDADGEHYHASRFSTAVPPPRTLFIAGTVTDRFRITYGIESYFVEEGEGKKYEEAIREHRLSAEVAVNSKGQAQLRGLRID